MGPALTANQEPSQCEKGIHLWGSGKENTSRDMPLRGHIGTPPPGPRRAPAAPYGQHRGDLGRKRRKNLKEWIPEVLRGSGVLVGYGPL